MWLTGFFEEIKAISQKSELYGKKEALNQWFGPKPVNSKFALGKLKLPLGLYFSTDTAALRLLLGEFSRKKVKIDHVRACQTPFSGRKIPRLAKQRDDYEKIGGVSGIIVRYGQI